jgi:hypothetical protein
LLVGVPSPALGDELLAGVKTCLGLEFQVSNLVENVGRGGIVAVDKRDASACPRILRPDMLEEVLHLAAEAEAIGDKCELDDPEFTGKARRRK